MLTHQGAVVKDVKFKRIAQITILFCLNKPKNTVFRKSLFPFDGAKLRRLFVVKNTRYAVSAEPVAETIYFVQFLMQIALFASPKALKNCFTTFFLLRISLGFFNPMNFQSGKLL